MRRSNIIITALVCAVCLCGCKDKKKVSEMSNEEKIAYEASDESRLMPDEKKLQLEVRQNIMGRAQQTDKSVAELEKAVADARDLLEDEDFANLEKAQDVWNRQGRGVDINRLVASGIAAADAYSEAFMKRAEWVRLRTSWAMLISMPGEFGGFYRGEASRTLEVYEMGNHDLNMVMRFDDNDFIYTASGSVEQGGAILKSEFDVMAAVRITVEGHDSLRLEPEESFDASSLGPRRALIEGVYQRVKPGVMDVFAQ